MPIPDQARLMRVLDRLEPHTPPSARYNRLVHYGAAEVLELRDPNDGQDPDPLTKVRHQYVRTGDIFWHRALPPEVIGDRWMGESAPSGFERTEYPVSGLLAELLPLLPSAPVAVLTRERFFTSNRCEYRVRGHYVAEEDATPISVIMGPITTTLWDVPLPPCPDCDGELVWFEAGFVPGTRLCSKCVSFFHVDAMRDST